MVLCVKMSENILFIGLSLAYTTLAGRTACYRVCDKISFCCRSLDPLRVGVDERSDGEETNILSKVLFAVTPSIGVDP